MPLSFQKRLQNIADEHNLDGDKQCAVSSYLIRHGSLFEHLDDVEAKSLLSSLDDGNIEKIIEAALNEWVGESVRTSAHSESVHTYAHSEMHVSTEERHQRALILDAKLEDALLESYQYMAEIIDEKLYKELGYDNARAYFEAKQITVNQAYKYALIGRTYKPYLSDPAARKKITDLGTSKIESIARNLEDQIPALMAGDTIRLGDEEYTAEDLKEFTVREVREEIKKANKKLEDYEVVKEQKKNAELERDHLAKENEELKGIEKEYRNRSIKQAQVVEDLDDVIKHWAKVQKLITRIELDECTDDVKRRLADIITDIQRDGKRLAKNHMETMLEFEHELAVFDDDDALDQDIENVLGK